MKVHAGEVIKRWSELDQLNYLDYCDDVEGMIGPSEGRIISSLASLLPKDEIAVEFGAWKGKSTSYMIAGLGKGRTDHSFYSCDWHLGDTTGGGVGGTWEPYQKHVDGAMERYGNRGVCKYYKGSMLDPAIRDDIRKDGRDIGLFFYDSDHEMPPSMKCLDLYKDLLAKDAVILLDDANGSNVQEFVREMKKIGPMMEIFWIKDFHQGFRALQYNRRNDWDIYYILEERPRPDLEHFTRGDINR